MRQAQEVWNENSKEWWIGMWFDWPMYKYLDRVVPSLRLICLVNLACWFLPVFKLTNSFLGVRVLGFKSRASYIPGKCSTTKLPAQPNKIHLDMDRKCVHWGGCKSPGNTDLIFPRNTFALLPLVDEVEESCNCKTHYSRSLIYNREKKSIFYMKDGVSDR